ncbi:DUF47 family protein [Paraflavisolibacter sp. H34]|uniref:DUF47 domain-containing protein n=1 Tax=Huijunlia imazamoxiresistens TaxID=3127457 RepID=UPI00301B1010
MASSFMKFFMPKDKVFYNLFEQAATNGALMAEKLSALVKEPDRNVRATLTQPIEDLEHANDELTHKIFTELGRNFITPFDREDIHLLATALDDIADYIYSCAKKIKLYHVDIKDEAIHKLTDLVCQATKEVRKAVMELRDMKNMRNITDALVKINSLENQADDISDIYIERLFSMEMDAREILKKREMYQVLEDVTDKCEDAANVIESIIVKYA